jgi:hypothetical protein
LVAQGNTMIGHFDSVQISFPNFSRDLQRLIQ